MKPAAAWPRYAILTLVAALVLLPLFVVFMDGFKTPGDLRVNPFGLPAEWTLDSVWGVALPRSAFGLALSIVLLRGFFGQLPPDLWGAANIDGCGHGRFLWHIVLPLSRPVLATVAVIVMVQSWNSYLLPLTLLNSARSYPWTIAITEFASEFSTAWEMTLAFITITLVPAIAFFLLAQRQLVAGLTGGAVKG